MVSLFKKHIRELFRIKTWKRSQWLSILAVAITQILEHLSLQINQIVANIFSLSLFLFDLNLNQNHIPVDLEYVFNGKLVKILVKLRYSIPLKVKLKEADSPAL